jgi:hypothetical protein
MYDLAFPLLLEFWVWEALSAKKQIVRFPHYGQIVFYTALWF